VDEGFRGRAPGAQLATLVVAAFVVFAAVQAFQIRVRFYDTYDYLNDARAILGDDGAGAAYYRVHAPVMPLVATLGAMAHDPADPANRWRWLVPHALAFLGALLTLAALGAFLARRHGRGPPWRRFWIWGLALFVVSPLFVRYSPHLLVDIPTAGAVAASLWLWDRVRVEKSWRWPVLLGVAWGVAMGLKYSLLLFPGVFAVAALVETAADRRLFSRRNARIALAGVVGLATFFALIAFVYDRAFEEGFSLERWIADLQQASNMVRPMEGDRPSDNLVLLAQVLSPVALVLAAIGLPSAMKAWRRDLPGLLWLVFFVAMLSFGVGHSEARYLYPVFPVVMHLAVLGLRTLWSPKIAPAGRARMRRTLRWVLPVALVAAALPGFGQMVTDRDPFFRRPTHWRVAELLVRELPPEGKVYFSGHFVVLAPPDPVSYERDEFFDFFHLGHPAIHFLTRRQVQGAHGPPEAHLRRARGEADAFVVGASRFHHTTDLLAGNPLPSTFTIWIRSRDADGQPHLEAHAFPSGDPSEAAEPAR
jgi:hypothetical protein